MATITPSTGDLGQKTNKDNLLTYSISNGTMSVITEKVNGITVGTKTATNGQSLTVSLTQAQWDAVRYGKYANATGGRNTLTIEMGTEVWTYTFDKIPPVDAQITELLKSHIDSADVAIPAKKALLGALIRGKGGAVNDTDSLEVMASAIGGIPLGRKWATGSFTGGDGLKTITGLTFKPSLVITHGGGSNVNKYFSISVESSTIGIRGISAQVNDSTISNGNPATMRSDGFTIYININTSSESRWIAIE